MKTKELEKIKLQAYADGFNAGFGKKKMRVSFCRKAGETVLQLKMGGKKWLCLHK